MANVKVPKLLHKMSMSAQKAWYKKHGMEMPSSDEGKSAAQAKKVKVVKKAAAAVKPQSIRDINAARQKAYYEKGGRAPIGAGGSGGSNSMAGVGMSNIKQIRAAIKAGVNPKVAESVVNEATKAEAEKMLGGPVKEKPKMPPGKQPAGYRYVRSLARKAMKAGLKKEEVEQVDEVKAVKAYDKKGKLVGRYRSMDHAKQMKPGHTYKVEEEVAVDEAKKPDASMAMTDQLKKKMITDKDKRTLGRVATLMAAQKKLDKKPMKEESEMQYIEEKLTASDPASKWISDFVKSDNPKFAGKSKKERIQQALGAYYAAKRGTNEQNEFLESKKMEKGEDYEEKEESEEEDEEEEEDEDEDEDEEEIDEAAKDWRRAFSNVAKKNLQKDVGKIRSKVGRLNYIGMKPKVDATPKVTAAVTKKGSYSEAVEGKTPETSTEVELAKKHGNPKKITYGDVVKARIEAAKKKALNKG